MGKRPPGRPPKYRAERFAGLPCTAKLVWFYILTEGPGPYSVEGVARGLGITTASAQKALKLLVERGLLEVVEPPRGSRAGVYRAASGRNKP